jgi:hypothetical protein
MADELAPLFARLEERAAQLNAASESVNAIIGVVEARLRNANVGLEVWLDRTLSADDVESAPGTQACVIQRLGYARLEGEWCLAVKPVRVENGFFEGDTSAPYHNEDWAGEAVRLSKTARSIRIAALAALPALLERIIDEAEACVGTIQEAKRLTLRSE